MKWSEAIIKAMGLPDPFFFRIVLGEVSKSVGRKPAYMNTFINDDIAKYIFDNLEKVHFCVVAVPKDIDKRPSGATDKEGEQHD